MENIEILNGLILNDVRFTESVKTEGAKIVYERVYNDDGVEYTFTCALDSHFFIYMAAGGSYGLELIKKRK